MQVQIDQVVSEMPDGNAVVNPKGLSAGSTLLTQLLKEQA